MSVLRTFVGIEASSEVRGRCLSLIRKLDSTEIKATWTRAENMHHTLKFLGDTVDRQLAEVCRAIARGAATVEPFELESIGVGAFPRDDAPRTVWIGAGAGKEAMISLQAAIDEQLHEVGFALEARRFQPHLTLGRVRKRSSSLEPLAQLIDEHRDFRAGYTVVDEVILFSSVLQKDGPKYEVLGRAQLGQS